MIDYIIGRLAGNYNPGDPLTYRSRYKQMDSSFARSDSKAFSFPLHSKIAIAHDSSQRNSSSDLPPHSKEHAVDQLQQQQLQQPNSSSVQPSIITPSSGFTTKFDRIQELAARALHGHEEVQALLRRVSIEFVKSGAKEEILDSCIEELQHKINVKEAQRYLSAAPIKESDKRPPLYGHHVQHLPESSRVKLAQIEQLLKNDFRNDVAVYEEIERLIKVRNISHDDTILNAELDNLLRRTK